MRALFLDGKDCFLDHRTVKVTGGAFQHLVKVARIKKGEKVLVLDGNGQIIRTTFLEMTRKEASLEIEDRSQTNREYFIDLAVGLVKKEALERVLGISVELGIQKIIPLKTKFSQQKVLNKDRFDRLIESSLIQANNPFKPQIHELASLEDLVFESYEEIYYFSSNPKFCIDKKRDYNLSKKTLILIGPEGGFSPEEENFLFKKFSKDDSRQSFHFIHLPTPILRTPTAVATSLGFILGRFLS